MLAFLLAPLNAHAGSYVGANHILDANGKPVLDSKGNPTYTPYSGGTYATPVPPNNSLPYSGTTSYGGTSGGVAIPSCSGTITVKYNWQPATGFTMTTDPPPAQVVVYEFCTATAGVGAPSVTGKCDTGLGSTGTISFTPGGTNSVTKISTLYTLQTGGASVTIKPAVTPSASVTQISGSCSVSYTATISPVFVMPGGTTPDGNGNYDILVGQGCTAGLTGIPTGTGWSATYQWTVSGTTFQKWVVSSDQKTATLNPGSGVLTNATAHWYWSEAAARENVSCTATVTPPSGQGSVFSVVAAQQVSVVVPSNTCTPHTGAVYVDSTGKSIDAIGTSSTYPHGETWACQVQTLALFGSGGSFNLSQTITPGRTKTYSSGAIPCTQNGKTGLDTVCPYTPPDDDPYTIGSGINAGWPADNSQHLPGDSPGSFLNTTVLKISISESFSTYVMYLPPGGDVQQVPLYKMPWTWAATISKPAGGWASTDGILAGTVTSTSAAPAYQHIVWSLLESNTIGSGW